MARYLYVRAGSVVNVVEHPDPPPETTEEGDDIILDPTGTTNAGEAFDPSDIRKDRQLDRVDVVVLNELFRLTNNDRAQDIPPKSVLTRAQYRAFLKSII